MNFIRRFFERTEIIFIIALAIPLLIDFHADFMKNFIDILLGIVLFFSIRSFFRHEPDFKSRKKPIIISLLLNYVLLSGVYLLIGYIVFGPGDLFKGYILLAIVPAAIAVVPLCYLSRCDGETADSTVLISFLASLVIIPVALFLVFGKSIDFWVLLKTLLIVVVVPLILAFLTRNSRENIFHYTKAITNVCLGLVIFAGVSINRHIFFSTSSLPVFYVNFVVIFALGILVYLIARAHAGHALAVNYALYASHKNEGTAIAIALTLFSPLVAIPAIIALVLQFLFFIIFEKMILKMWT